MYKVDTSAVSVFFRQFSKNPFQVGSLFPSSTWLGNKMLSGLAAKDVKFIVEYGPGTGSFTQKITNFLLPDSRFLACEPNTEFYSLLKTKFPQAELVNDYADAAPRYLGNDTGKVDLVVSGLPFSLMKTEVVLQTIDDTHLILKPGGQFRTFVYFHTLVSPQVLKLLKRVKERFSEVAFESELRNFPPAIVIRCTK